MPVDVFEEVLPLEIDVLEAAPLSPGSPEGHKHSYPFPWLRKTDQRQTIDFRTIVLENEYLRVMVVPDLGGRILRLLDKRTDTDILGLPDGTLTDDAPRGADLIQGLQWTLDGSRARLNSLGPVEVHISEPEDADEEAAILIHELSGGLGHSEHVRISLAPGVAKLQIAFSVFHRELTNREVAPKLVSNLVGTDYGPAVYDSAQRKGLWVGGSLHPGHVEGPNPLVTAQWSLIAAGVKSGQPRLLLTAKTSVAVFSGLEMCAAVSEHAAVEIGDTLRIQASQSVSGAKIVILTRDGRTLESGIDLYPETIAELNLGFRSAEIAALAILANSGTELLRYEAQVKGTPENRRDLAGSTLDASYGELCQGGDPRRLLDRSLSDIGERSAALNMKGIYLMKQGLFAEADLAFEDALLYNAEDHLAWWAKAVAARHAGADPDEERSELLNAHFLAPLEPVLRAECFLASAVDSSAVLKPLLDNPDALVEVGCLLHEMGLHDDLSKWANECLKHREIPMLRYLLADALLTKTRMLAEAAQHVVTASKMPVNPPYPYRKIEIAVLKRLTKSFPDDARITDLLKLWEWATC